MLSLLPTIILDRNERATKVHSTSIFSKSASCPTHLSMIVKVPYEFLLLNEGYIRANLAKYRDWKVFAKERESGQTAVAKEKDMYME